MQQAERETEQDAETDMQFSMETDRQTIQQGREQECHAWLELKARARSRTS
jgi:hypothetical protein